MRNEYDWMTVEQLEEAIKEGWRNHWGMPSNSLAVRLHRMEKELEERKFPVMVATE